MLDTLCLTGEVGWARVTSASTDDPTDVVGATPIALFLREHADVWTTAGTSTATPATVVTATTVRAALQGCRDRRPEGLRSRCPGNASNKRSALLPRAPRRVPGRRKGPPPRDRGAGSRGPDHVGRLCGLACGRARHEVSGGGRWSAIATSAIDRDTVVQRQAWALLRRCGVVFRRLLTREANAAPWRELTRVYRRLEARGEIRGRTLRRRHVG